MLKSKLIMLITFTLLSCNSMHKKQNVNNENRTKNETIKNGYLTTEEANLLNSLLEKSRGDFDFSGKQVAFICGFKSRFSSKTNFLNTCIYPWINNGTTPQVFMLLLSQEEKERSGGYDVLVLAWIKVLTSRQKNKLIDKLGKKSRRSY